VRAAGDILLRVNYAVSKQNKLVDKYGSVYQISAPAFTLTKKLYFVAASRQLNAPPSMPTAIEEMNDADAADADTIPATAERRTMHDTRSRINQPQAAEARYRQQQWS
jgi:hypothetical protein